MGTSQAKMPSSSGGFRNYLKDPSRTAREYYDDGDGFQLTWGRLARRFGVEDGLSDAQFDDLHAGRWNGETLTRSGYRKVEDPATGDVTTVSHRTPGYDITFMAPKEISALYARAATQQQADAVANVVFEAARVAWEEGVEAFARGARVRGQKMTADLLGVPVLQFTARPTDATEARGAPADPHLHVHTATFALCAVGDDFYQFDGAAIFRTAEYRDAIFMGELARRIENLGYGLDYSDFHTSRKGRVLFSPHGNDAALNRHWSSQTERSIALAREFEASHGKPPTDRELRALMRVTKSKKADREMDSHPSRERWTQAAREAGFDPSPLSPTHRPATTPRRHGRADYDELTARLFGLSGIHRDGDAVFGEDAIKPAIARAAVGLGFTRAELLAYEMQFREQLIAVRPAADADHVLYTTPANLEAEESIAKSLGLRTRTPRIPVPNPVRAFAAEHAKQKLDAAQREAFEKGCHVSGFTIWTGNAGAGKSTTAAATVQAWRQSGLVTNVVATATASKRALDFGSSIGADRAGSIDSILYQAEKGSLKLDDKTLILIDEVALVDNFRMAKLLKVADRARIIAIGDDKQLTAIAASGWFRDALDRYGSTHLTKVHRHIDQRDTETYQLIREGRGAEAVESLRDRGRVHVAPDAGTRLQAVMADYRAVRGRGAQAHEIRQVVEGSNHDVDTLNRFVQYERASRSEIRGPGFEVEDTSQGRRWRLHEGDQVVFLASVWERGQPPIPNGTEGTVERLASNGSVLVALDNGRRAQVHLQAVRETQPLGLAYSQHQAKFQGSEVKFVQSLPSLATTEANSGYTQLTRATNAAHVYLDASEAPEQAPLETLAERWSEHVEVRSARSYLVENPEADTAVDPRQSPSPVTREDRAEAYRQRMAQAYEQSLTLTRTLTPGL